MKISIVTINYNNGNGLENTIKSVISQKYQNFQYIVIDGDSTDNSQDVLKKYAESITYSISEKDKGIYHAMNKGIAVAEGEYILFLNSGDTFYDASVLQKVLPFLESVDLLSGSTNLIEDGKNTIVKSQHKLTFKHMFRYSIDHPSTFIKRSLFKTIGQYDENLKIVADWKWFIIALAKHNVSYKDTDIIISTFIADGISSKPENRNALLKERRTVLEQEFPFFLKDYEDLIEFEPLANNFEKIKRSGWVKMGQKIGLMKNVNF